MVRKCDGALKKIGAPSFTPLARGGTQHFLRFPGLWQAGCNTQRPPVHSQMYPNERLRHSASIPDVGPPCAHPKSKIQTVARWRSTQLFIFQNLSREFSPGATLPDRPCKMVRRQFSVPLLSAERAADPESKLVLLDLARRWLCHAAQADTIADRQELRGDALLDRPDMTR
jgi:hypothetical protein